jgi:ribosomal protein S18 acetylase RimI-like enzyme
MNDRQDNCVMIRKSIRNDLDELIVFGKESFTETFGHLYPKVDLIHYLNESYHNDKFMDYIENNNKYGCFVAIDNNKIVGYILTCKGANLPDPQITENCYEIIKLYVNPSYFGKGVSHLLMNEGISWINSQNNCKDIWLSVYSDNIRAQKFYEKYGFKFSREYGYVVGNSIDREFIYRKQKE